MISFESDYNRGVQEKILKRMMEINQNTYKGYGNDEICESAREKIRRACKKEEAEVAFVSGGTQTNQLVIDSMLESYEGVLAAKTGHVSLHEAGAIEFSGHKVLQLPSYEGKIKAEDVKNFLLDFYADGNHEHMVFPGMVYISYPTEYGTLYSKQELKELSEICRSYQIPLYADGARLGYGLMSPKADLSLAEFADLVDVFYIGGTKVGALFGEAIVFSNVRPPKHFLTQIKQHGALLAKGWLLGLQFDVLFEDDLYFKISKNAIEMAERLTKILKEKGYSLLMEMSSNQIFVILENERLKKLEEHVRVSFWEAYDERHTVVRFATSYATSQEDLEKLEALL